MSLAPRFSQRLFEEARRSAPMVDHFTLRNILTAVLDAQAQETREVESKAIWDRIDYVQRLTDRQMAERVAALSR